MGWQDNIAVGPWSGKHSSGSFENSSVHDQADRRSTTSYTATTQRPKGKEAVATVEFTVRISHLDFASVSARENAQVRLELTTVLKGLISSEAGDVVTPEHVDLSLSAGSVIAEVSIRPPASISASSVQSNLRNNQLQMLSGIADGIKEVNGITAVSTGPIMASIIRKPAVRQALTTTAAPATEPASASKGIDASIMIAASIVCFVIIVGVAFLLACMRRACWRKCCALQKSSTEPKGIVVAAIPTTGPMHAGVVKGSVIDNVVDAV